MTAHERMNCDTGGSKMFTSITKRDGRVEAFDKVKITKAIFIITYRVPFEYDKEGQL